MTWKRWLVKIFDALGLLALVEVIVAVLTGYWFLPFYGFTQVSLSLGDKLILEAACGIGCLLIAHRLQYALDRSQATPTKQQKFQK